MPMISSHRRHKDLCYVENGSLGRSTMVMTNGLNYSSTDVAFLVGASMNAMLWNVMGVLIFWATPLYNWEIWLWMYIIHVSDAQIFKLMSCFPPWFSEPLLLWLGVNGILSCPDRCLNPADLEPLRPSVLCEPCQSWWQMTTHHFTRHCRGVGVLILCCSGHVALLLQELQQLLLDWLSHDGVFAQCGHSFGLCF